ncbi:sugar phosphate isomerase/epimerase family protein [Acutalibacter intestini]|uniref:sugar phosphate isomerase/epimerase family protein n=1 Tax=Acutalibacter intestini TaxID=3093659 RepID=UPI002AC8C48C|nr:sugar phosphate isomerase/epimerase [Acutalibacter sp. M00204]
MKLGAQLYTLREYTQNEKDLDYSLGRVSEMGYQTVQLSAIGPIAPQRVRQLCDKHGLEIVLTHTEPGRILNDTQAVIEEHEVFGCRYIGIGMMPKKYLSPEWLWHFADDYQEPAKKIAAAGKLLMYHNHNVEFQRFGGKLVMDVLLESFAPDELGFTLDTYWVQMGGADLYAWLEKLSGRIPCVHLKDMAVNGWEPVMAPVGEGNIDFGKVLKTLAHCGTEHILVEQDVCQGSPFDCLKQSLRNIQKLETA